MKLAIVRQRYNPFGGAERFIEKALKGLSNSDLTLFLLTRHWLGDNPSNLHVVKHDPFYMGSTWRDWSFSNAIQSVLKSNQYDCIQSHERIPGCHIYRAGDGVHRRWLEQRSQYSDLGSSTPDALNPYHRYTLAAEKQMFEHPELRAVICNSRMVRQDIQRYFQVDDNRLPIVYNGIQTNIFNTTAQTHRNNIRSQYKIPLDVPLFLFVGSGFERKGLAQALRCLPPHSWLLVVGHDKKQSHYEQLAEKLKIGHRVIFAGPQKQVQPFYGAADAFVFPTIYEPFGNVVLEAMACGLPVITSSFNGASEVIENNVSGFVLATLSDEPLRESMNRLSDVDVASRMGAKAAVAAESFSIENMVNDLMTLYKTLF